MHTVLFIIIMNVIDVHIVTVILIVVAANSSDFVLAVHS